MKQDSYQRFYLISACVALLFPLFLNAGTSVQAQNTVESSAPQLLKVSMRAFARPEDLVVTSDGGYLLVADTGNNEIKILQPGTLKILSQFATGDLKAPNSIEIDKSGTVLVVDNANKRSTSYTFKGVFRDGSANVKKVGSRRISAEKNVKSKFSVNQTGQRYVANSRKNQVEIFDKSGTQISTYGTNSLKTPMAVETVGRYFWIADTGNNRILLLKAPIPLKQ